MICDLFLRKSQTDFGSKNWFWKLSILTLPSLKYKIDWGSKILPKKDIYPKKTSFKWITKDLIKN